MRTPSRHLPLALALALGASAGGAASAKVITDGSMGGGRSVVPGPNSIIPHTLGQRRGQNLFHSFERLNLRQGESATFAGPGSVRNIFARVTNGQPTKIRGRLGSSIEGANLLLINSSGVVFGEGATLDLSGAFIATTANTIHFADGSGAFPASAVDQATLTSAAPASFGFLPGSAGPVTVQGATLQVDTGQSLGVVAGDVILDGGTLLAREGRIAIASGELVRFSSSETGPPLSSDNPTSRLTIVRDGLVRVDDDGTGVAGRIDLLTREIRMDEGFVTAQSLGDGEIDPRNQGIHIVATDSLHARVSFIATGAFGAGPSGGITLETGELRLAGNEFGDAGGLFSQNGSAGGKAGDIVVNANVIRLRRTGQILSNTQSNAAAPDVVANGLRVLLTNGGFIGSTTQAEGDGSDVRVMADEVLISGNGTRGTGIFSSTVPGVAGRGGNVTVEADRLSVLDLGAISATSGGSGRGGNVNVTADSILLDGADQRAFTGIAANTQARRGGPGGQINVETNSLTLRDGAGIAARSRGTGRPGNINVVTTGTTLIDGTNQLTGITTETLDRIPADGGNISIQSGGDILLLSGQINAKTSRDEGNIRLRSTGHVIASAGSEITAQAARTGGQIDINADLVILRDASIINGLAGGEDVLVSVQASSLLLDFNSAILTDRPAFQVDDTVGQGVIDLSAVLADPNLRLSEVCARVVESTSSFIARNRGTLPVRPGGLTVAIDIAQE